jgi:hypothetical protein
LKENNPMRPKIKEDVKVKAEIMVPVSENPITQAVFNGVVEAELRRECRTSEEVETVYEMMAETHEQTIDAALSGVEVDPSDSEDLAHVSAIVASAIQEAD